MGMQADAVRPARTMVRALPLSPPNPSPRGRGEREGHYERKVDTKAGVVTLKIPMLRTLPFEVAIIDRYR
jgi:transposase-like protein